MNKKHIVPGDLLENYCRGDHLMNVTRIMFCLSILFTSPIECFVARDLIIQSLSKKFKENSIGNSLLSSKFVVTFLLVVTACLVSFSTDCLGIVLEFNVRPILLNNFIKQLLYCASVELIQTFHRFQGVFAAIPLAYILPALCYLRLEPSTLKSWKKLPAIIMAAVAVFTSLGGLVMIILNWDVNSSCSHGVEMSYCRSWLNSSF